MLDYVPYVGTQPEKNRPKVYRTIDLLDQIDSPAHHLDYILVESPYMTAVTYNQENLTSYMINTLSNTTFAYAEEVEKYASRLQLVYDSSSYKFHTISYVDADYLTTKVGALIALYTKTVG